jgi:hypothetical protein
MGIGGEGRLPLSPGYRDGTRGAKPPRRERPRSFALWKEAHAVPVYDSIISRCDADALIPKDVAGELIAAATGESAALTLFRNVQLSTKLATMPVLAALPVAYLGGRRHRLEADDRGRMGRCLADRRGDRLHRPDSRSGDRRRQLRRVGPAPRPARRRRLRSRSTQPRSAGSTSPPREQTNTKHTGQIGFRHRGRGTRTRHRGPKG